MKWFLHKLYDSALGGIVLAAWFGAWLAVALTS